jgi:hypothetical protein
MGNRKRREEKGHYPFSFATLDGRVCVAAAEDTTIRSFSRSNLTITSTCVRFPPGILLRPRRRRKRKTTCASPFRPSHESYANWDAKRMMVPIPTRMMMSWPRQESRVASVRSVSRGRRPHARKMDSSSVVVKVTMRREVTKATPRTLRRRRGRCRLLLLLLHTMTESHSRQQPHIVRRRRSPCRCVLLRTTSTATM